MQILCTAYFSMSDEDSMVRSPELHANTATLKERHRKPALDHPNEHVTCRAGWQHQLATMNLSEQL